MMRTTRKKTKRVTTTKTDLRISLKSLKLGTLVTVKGNNEGVCLIIGVNHATPAKMMRVYYVFTGATVLGPLFGSELSSIVC